MEEKQAEGEDEGPASALLHLQIAPIQLIHLPVDEPQSDAFMWTSGA